MPFSTHKVDKRLGKFNNYMKQKEQQREIESNLFGQFEQTDGGILTKVINKADKGATSAENHYSPRTKKTPEGKREYMT